MHISASIESLVAARTRTALNELGCGYTVQDYSAFSGWYEGRVVISGSVFIKGAHTLPGENWAESGARWERLCERVRELIREPMGDIYVAADSDGETFLYWETA